jgi:AraC family transcriptional regulator
MPSLRFSCARRISRLVNEVDLNPPSHLLGRVNAVLSARARQYSMRPFAGPLSIKTVVEGSAAWTTRAGRYVVEPGHALLLNDGEEYVTEVDSPQPVETFCVFFARGYVEDAVHAIAGSSATLLDGRAARAFDFVERIHFDKDLLTLVGALRDHRSEANLGALALHLAGMQENLQARVSSLPALRATTREELARRIRRATDYIHANVGSSVLLADIAAAAAMSPFHLHRTFTSFHGLTPHAYIARLRFERARSMLRTTTRPVLDIALSCGFESVGSFTTAFTRRYGVPPARFRKIEEGLRPEQALSSQHE